MVTLGPILTKAFAEKEAKDKAKVVNEIKRMDLGDADLSQTVRTQIYVTQKLERVEGSLVGFLHTTSKGVGFGRRNR